MGYSLGQIPLFTAVSYKIENDPNLTSADYTRFFENPDFLSIGLDPNLGFLLLLCMFLFAVMFFFVGINFLHHKSFKKLITPYQNIDFKKILFGFGLWMALAIVAESVFYIMQPGNYTFSFDLIKFLPLVLISLIFLPIQTTFEEVFFRGYLLQGFGLLLKNRWMPLVITSLLFGLIHITNPEIQKYGLLRMEIYYVLAALFLGLITILDDSLELAIGVHAATNMFGAVFVSYTGSVIQTDSLLKSTEVNVYAMIVVLIISSCIFTLICYKKYKWDLSSRLFSPISFSQKTV